MHDALALLERIPSVLTFLLALTIVAECCSVTGVFDAMATTLVTAGRGRTATTWALFMTTTALVTCLLSLDTTAVLMTSASVVVARRIGAPVALFAFPTLWLANMASLWLPVSNLTNLLARDHLDMSDAMGFLALSWPVAVTTTVAPLVCAAVIWRRDLRGATSNADASFSTSDGPARGAGETLEGGYLAGRERTARTAVAVITTVMCVTLLFVEPWMAAGTAALVCLLTVVALMPSRVREVELPWRSLLITAALFVAVAVLHGSGALDPLVDELRSAPPWALAVSAGALANLTNNLPTYLALEPATGSDTARVFALLVGVNVTSGITWWGSVATLLWRDRLRREGIDVSLRRHLALTGGVTIITTAAALIALTLTR